MNPFDRIFNLKIKLIFPVIMFLVNNWTSARQNTRKISMNFGQISMIITPILTSKILIGKVKEIYEPQSSRISNDDEFITFIENVLNELYNGIHP
jgi:carboxyl-terminal processing protease